MVDVEDNLHWKKEDASERMAENGKDNDTCLNVEPNLSKKALKRLKKREAWNANRPARRAAEKERRKRRAAADRELRRENPDQALLTRCQDRKRLKDNKMKNSACRINVVIDCSWDYLMDERDINKLAHQIQYSYTTNRRLADPMQFYVTGLGSKSKLKQKFDTDYNGYQNWDLNFKETDFDLCFDHSKIVYLSSESDNVLSSLEDDKAYVIGGLVDHNHHKGVCHEQATKKKIFHARLPIDEFMILKTRKVLTVNQVFDILAAYSKHQDWKKAFLEAIPLRKGGQVKNDLETKELIQEEDETVDNLMEETEAETGEIEESSNLSF